MPPPALAIGSDVTPRAVKRNEPEMGPSRKRALEGPPLAWQGARQRQRRGTPGAVCRLPLFLVVVVLPVLLHLLVVLGGHWHQPTLRLQHVLGEILARFLDELGVAAEELREPGLVAPPL